MGKILAIRLTPDEGAAAKKKIGPAPRAVNAKKLKDMHGWVTEPEDDLVPTDGWLTDFVASKRGWESPTLYGLWAGLGIMSNICKRDAYLEWADDILVPNLYMIYVGPPAVVRKSFTTGMISDFMNRWPDYLEMMKERVYKARKKIDVIEGMSTIEKVFEDLGNPTDIYVKDESTGEAITINPGSAGLLLIPELTTVISKDVKYAGQLLDNLCDWYDCKTVGSQHRTKTSGDQRLKNVFFNMVAATTPTAVKAHLPPAALGGGFLSRTLFLYKENTARSWSRPKLLAGCPTRDILQVRMLWCMKNSDGEFILTPEADAWYDDWYERYKISLDNGDDVYRNVHGRMGINILKVGMLLRAQEYRVGRDIAVRHLELAERLLEMSLQTTMQFLGQIQTNPLYELQEMLIDYLKRKRECSVGQIQTVFSKRLDSATLQKVLYALWLQGMVSIVVGEKPINPKDGFILTTQHSVLFNNNKFITRDQEVNSSFKYDGVRSVEIDEQNIHRAHPLGKDEAQMFEMLAQHDDENPPPETESEYE